MQKNLICYLHDLWSISHDLMKITANAFSLNMEVCANPLTLTGILPHYASFSQDYRFLAMAEIFSPTCLDKNIYIMFPLKARLSTITRISLFLLLFSFISPNSL